MTEQLGMCLEILVSPSSLSLLTSVVLGMRSSGCSEENFRFCILSSFVLPVPNSGFVMLSQPCPYVALAQGIGCWFPPSFLGLLFSQDVGTSLNAGSSLDPFSSCYGFISLCPFVSFHRGVWEEGRGNPSKFCHLVLAIMSPFKFSRVHLWLLCWAVTIQPGNWSQRKEGLRDPGTWWAAWVACWAETGTAYTSAWLHLILESQISGLDAYILANRTIFQNFVTSQVWK